MANLYGKKTYIYLDTYSASVDAAQCVKGTLNPKVGGLSVMISMISVFDVNGLK